MELPNEINVANSNLSHIPNSKKNSRSSTKNDIDILERTFNI